MGDVFLELCKLRVYSKEEMLALSGIDDKRDVWSVEFNKLLLRKIDGHVLLELWIDRKSSLDTVIALNRLSDKKLKKYC